MTFGERLRSIREEQKLTQSELGRRSKLTAAAIWQVENDRREPRCTTLGKLADALQVSVDSLMNRTTDEELLQDASNRILLQQYNKLTTDDKEVVRILVVALLKIY